LIISPLTGNFGDNIKSYLLTRIIADKKGYDWGLNRHPEYDYGNGTPQLDFFNIHYGNEHNFKYAEVPPWITNIWEEKAQIIEHAGEKLSFYDYQPDIFDQPDGTKFVVKCAQDARYYQDYKEKIQDWLTIKKENQQQYELWLTNNGIFLDEDMCVLSIRGGEFRGVPNLILPREYWQNARRQMKKYNPNMRFLIVSDDPQYAGALFDYSIPVMHYGIGGDYFTLLNAKNLILSNSGFGIFPAWLNKNNPYTIAPRYFARYNTGVWCSGNVWTFGFKFLDKDGELYDK
jgi:hypothetical protein